MESPEDWIEDWEVGRGKINRMPNPEQENGYVIPFLKRKSHGCADLHHTYVVVISEECCCAISIVYIGRKARSFVKPATFLQLK